jgi:hypothetical protein
MPRKRTKTASEAKRSSKRTIVKPMHNPSNLEALPHLPLDHIISFLDISTTLSLRATCCTLRKFITDKHPILAPLLKFRTVFEEEYNKIQSTIEDGMDAGNNRD